MAAGSKKLTNKAALWYVPCSLKNVDKILDVPPIKVSVYFLFGGRIRGLEVCSWRCILFRRQDGLLQGFSN